MTSKGLLLLLVVFPRARPAGGRISGRLTDPQGEAVAAATLGLAAIFGGPVVEPASDRGGWFVFATVAPGDNKVRASAASFDELRQTGTPNWSRMAGRRCQTRSRG